MTALGLHYDFHRQRIGSRLHEKLGFPKVAHLRDVGQKFNQRFEAVYMQLLLGGKDAPGFASSGDLTGGATSSR